MSTSKDTSKEASASLINNKDLVLFALYECGGASNSIHTEKIAVKVFESPLGKQRFRWQYYDYPDKERVYNELLRMTGRNKDFVGVALVIGNKNIGARKDRKDGWMLTEAGLERIQQLEGVMRKTLKVSTGNHHRYSEVHLRKRITSSRCYHVYLRDPEMKAAKEYHFTDLLECLPDEPRDSITKAYKSLITSVKAVNAKDLLDFLDAARSRFKELLTI